MTRSPRSRRPARSLEMRSAASAIADTLRFHGITDDVRANRLLVEWADLVGPRIAQRTRPDRVAERTLYIEVANSAWLQELNLLRPQILAGLLQRVGEPRLFDKLEFKLAGRTRRDSVVPPRPRPRAAPAQRPPPAPASAAAREKIIKDVERVDDAELRELIARVRITHDK